MSANYAAHLNTPRTQARLDKTAPVANRADDIHQSTPEEGLVKNDAGGYVFEASDLTKLDRFLILGAEGGTFYSKEKTLTREAAKTAEKLINQDGLAVIKRVVEISDAGRAIKNDPAIFVLALAASSKDPVVAAAAFDALPKVARTGTHLFTFAEYANALRGWGKTMKKGFANWYESKSLDTLAYGALKYKQRNGWSHRDLFRLAHIKTTDASRNALYRYIVRGEKTDGVALPAIIGAVESVVATPTRANAIKNIKEHNLSFEMLPTELLKNPDIWEAMLPTMGITALIRNLGKMSSIGLLGQLSDSAGLVIDRLTSAEQLAKGRVHPVSILAAQMIYASGHGDKGSLTWNTNKRIVDALNDAFYASFQFVKPTGKRFLLGIDCSGSMFGSGVAGITGLDAASAAAVMAMVTARVERNYAIMGFGGSTMGELPINPSMKLNKVLQVMRNFNWGSTDCALPMLYADKNKMNVDCFSVYTDNETWAGQTKPHTALERYRAKTGINAKLAVVGMCVNDFSIANPNDPLMMDLVGFDTKTPLAIAELAMM